MKGVFVALALFLASCGSTSDWGSGSESPWVDRCPADRLPLTGGRPIAMTYHEASSSLYVLDDFSGVWGFSVDENSLCGWELRQNFGEDGLLRLDGFAEALDVNSRGTLYWKDGTRVRSTESEDFMCNAGTGDFSIRPSGVDLAIAGGSGIKTMQIDSRGCIGSGQWISSWPSTAIDSDRDRIVAVELQANKPFNLIAMDWDGSVFWRTPLDQEKLCSAKRLVVHGAYIVVLDSECERLAVFGSEGNWIQNLYLDSAGIRMPVDLAITEAQELHLLNSSATSTLTYRLESWTW